MKQETIHSNYYSESYKNLMRKKTINNFIFTEEDLIILYDALTVYWKKFGEDELFWDKIEQLLYYIDYLRENNIYITYEMNKQFCKEFAVEVNRERIEENN